MFPSRRGFCQWFQQGNVIAINLNACYANSLPTLWILGVLSQRHSAIQTTCNPLTGFLLQNWESSNSIWKSALVFQCCWEKDAAKFLSSRDVHWCGWMTTNTFFRLQILLLWLTFRYQYPRWILTVSPTIILSYSTVWKSMNPSHARPIISRFDTNDIW